MRMKYLFIWLIYLITNELIKAQDEYSMFTGSIDPLFPYQINTGAGNREELRLYGLLKNSSLTGLSSNVTKWSNLKIGNTQYLAGASDSTLSVIITKMDSSLLPEMIVLDLHYSKEEMPGTLGPLTLVEHWNRTSKIRNPFLLVVTSNYGIETINCFRITPHALENVYHWELSTYGNALAMHWLREDDKELLLLAVQDEYGRTVIDLYHYEFEDSTNPHFLKILCLEKWYLNYVTTVITAVLFNDRIFLAAINADYIEIYTYDLSSEIGTHKKPQLRETLEAGGVTQVELFRSVGFVFFVNNGNSPNIWKLPNIGYDLEPMLKHPCGHVEDWIILKVPTYREDVVLLGRGGVNNSDVTVLVWRGSLHRFVTVKPPPCILTDSNLNTLSVNSEGLDCLLDGDWSRVAVLSVGHVPSFLMSSITHEDGLMAMYHLNCSLFYTSSPGRMLAEIHYDVTQMKERLTVLSNEFEDTIILEPRSSKRITETQGWPSLQPLDSCLAELDSQIDELNNYVEIRKANNMKASMSLDKGFLTGKASGKVLNQTVSAEFRGKLIYGPLRASEDERKVALDGQITINESKKYNVRTSARLGDLHISGIWERDHQLANRNNNLFTTGSLPPSPELPQPKSHSSKYQVDKPLQENVYQEMYG